MNAFFLLEARRSIKHWPACVMALLLVLTGIFCGNQFNLTVGEGIYLNSPYTVGFMTGMLSLVIIFLAIIYAIRILFKDWDSKFSALIFSYPFSKQTYVKGKFLTFFLQTFLSFTLLMSGFIIGQNLRTGSEIQPFFNFRHYLYPVLVFGSVNSMVVCSFLFFIAFTTRKKLLTVTGGLFLYVVYMIIMVFSDSPFMAGSLPQSLATQQFSALADPFGISSYFLEAKMLTVKQKEYRCGTFFRILTDQQNGVPGYFNPVIIVVLQVIFVFRIFPASR